jgi:hypothetical protein
VRRLAALGIKVTVIDEKQFWRLAKPRPRTKVVSRRPKAHRA